MYRPLALAAFTILSAAAAHAAGKPTEHPYGPAFRSAAPAALPAPAPGLDVVRRWNHIAIDATGLDHTPVGPGETRVFGEQLGPGRASRAMAVVHLAMFDTYDAMIGRYKTYSGIAAP